jgi:hypothetical protein
LLAGSFPPHFVSARCASTICVDGLRSQTKVSAAGGTAAAAVAGAIIIIIIIIIIIMWW